MMTFKDLKKLVELPSYKEQRVPTVKALEVSGVPVVTEKVLENHGSMRGCRLRTAGMKQKIPCTHRFCKFIIISGKIRN